MLKWLKNYFSRETEEEHKDFFKIKLNENALVFTIDEENRMIIRISAQLLSKDNAQKMAEALFLLGKGFYRPQILEMFQEMSEQDPSRAEFLSQVILYWGVYLDKYKEETYNNDGPVVSPSKFSQLVINPER